VFHGFHSWLASLIEPSYCRAARGKIVRIGLMKHAAVVERPTTLKASQWGRVADDPDIGTKSPDDPLVRFDQPVSDLYQGWIEVIGLPSRVGRGRSCKAANFVG
jgi:hypothetical protein